MDNVRIENKTFKLHTYRMFRHYNGIIYPYSNLYRHATADERAKILQELQSMDNTEV